MRFSTRITVKKEILLKMRENNDRVQDLTKKAC